MNPEIEFLYKEHLEASRLFLWYQGSKYSFHQGKANKTEAEQQRYLSNYFFTLLLKKIRPEK